MEHTTQRVRYIAIFTVDAKIIEQVCDRLGQKLSESFGGVTIYTGEGCNGFWSENANEYLETYNDTVNKERIVTVQLSVMPALAQSALKQLQANITKICLDLGAQTQYVHIESEIVTAHHFKITR